MTSEASPTDISIVLEHICISRRPMNDRMEYSQTQREALGILLGGQTPAHVSLIDHAYYLPIMKR